MMVDVEGGAAVLFVTPEGKSLLIDTGWPPGLGGVRPAPGAAPRPSSADRIAAAAASLGVKKIDYLLMTHYHRDHVGGLEALLAKMPVGTFIDHGPNREIPEAGQTPSPDAPAVSYSEWVKAYEGHGHISPHTGDKLEIGSMHLQFVTGDGEVLKAPLAGAGQADPACANVAGKDEIGGEENVRSLGTLVTYGKTRILEMGDLTWNKEVELLCPVNKIGKVDVYFVDHHGMGYSSSPPTVALSPIVALMQNGAMKGGEAAAIQTVNSIPGLEGFWKSHYSTRFPELRGDPDYIANVDATPDESYPIAVAVTLNGKITVTNGRNQFSKTYQSHASR